MKAIRHGNKRSKKRAQRIRVHNDFAGEWLHRHGVPHRWPRFSVSSDSYAIRLADLV
jgi:hypothetical protein